ncbi:hypothetical protein JCM31598_42800 [Desulfonatronum parangueonense]
MILHTAGWVQCALERDGRVAAIGIGGASVFGMSSRSVWWHAGSGPSDRNSLGTGVGGLGETDARLGYTVDGGEVDPSY